MDRTRLESAYLTARDALLAERAPGGYWVGELSTSALSTAVAVCALSLVQKAGRGSFQALINGGLSWLAGHQNADGGWGDTVKSFSNISTTLLGRSAFHIAGQAERYPDALARSKAWLDARYGTTPAQVAEAVRRRYGTDRTFSVPILMTCALAGLAPWREVTSLPFELACFPQPWYRFLGLPVVSYALPALIAIGQAVFHHRPPWDPFRRALRLLAIRPSLRVLDSIQPPNGGFLEAAPLTGFVTMGLASTGKADHVVVQRAVSFLVNGVRPDGSWPIDTNLSTWVTTLSVNALAAAKDLSALDRQEALRAWLIGQQYTERHPFTGAAPGAWAWTPLPGGVPDADDTPGAILALTNLQAGGWRGEQARGWLGNLQNSDGGMPTFCRGWTKMPFDRSGSDLTAHALRAWHALGIPPNQAALAYLAREQRPDGSWLPLWFGNQHAPDDVNPTYGTSRVLAAYRDLGLLHAEEAQRGLAFLASIQNADGGWGGAAGCPSSTEETALALDVLIGQAPATIVDRGLTWLVKAVESERWREPSPIGFYFAKLWYFEKLYPLIWAVMALGRARVAQREG
jgi:squalene-hopene/tetraprenyl-beta-curcumene cyclase